MDETPTEAFLTEAGSFRLFGHPHMQGLAVLVHGIRANGVARLVVKKSDPNYRVGEYVGPDCYYVPQMPREEV